MGPTDVERGFPRLRRPGSSRGFLPTFVLMATLVAVLVPTSVATPARGVAAPRAGDHVPASLGATALRGAETSLESGYGPAHGTPFGCQGTTALQCSPQLRPHPNVGPKGYWLNLTTGSNAPSDRETVAMTYDPADGYVLLFGGGQFNNLVSNAETWTFQAGGWTERFPASSPGPRLGAGMVYDSADGYVVMFGGLDRGSGTFLSDTWTYLGGTWTSLSPSSSPSARWAVGMAYDALDKYVVLFGGEAGFGSYQSDTWEFSGGSWTQVYPVNNPSKRADANMGYDATGKVAVLYSGEAGGSSYNDTWTFTGGKWTNLTSKLLLEPIAETADSFDYDPIFQGMVLQENAGAGGPTYIFASGAWKLLATSNHPPSLFHSKGTYDGADGYFLEFGGQVAGSATATVNYSWVLGVSKYIVLLTATPGGVDVNQPVFLSMAVTGAPKGITYHYWGLPAGCSDVNASTLTCSPTTVGNYTLNASVTDPAGASAYSPNTTLVVGAHPVVRSFTVFPTPLTESRPLVVTTTLSAGTPPLTYYYGGLPSGCATQNVSGFTCLPTTYGNFTVNVTVTDSRGFQAQANASLRIYPRLTLSTLGVSPSNILDTNETIHLVASSTGGTPPVVFVFLGLPGGCTSNDQTTLTCAPTTSGFYNVTLNASDGGSAFVTRTVSFVVSNDPVVGPLIAQPPAVDVGSTLSLSAKVVGGTGPYTVAWSHLPPGCIANAQLSFSCAPSGTGNYSPEISLTDTLGFVTNATTNVTVNTLPRIVSVSYPTGGWDAGRPFTIAASAAGGTGALTYAYQFVGGAGCGAGATSNVTLCNVSHPATVQFKLTVTDVDGRSVSYTGDIAVQPALSIADLAPQPVLAEVGVTEDFSFTVTGGTSPITPTLTGMPADCTLATSPFDFQCTPLVAGTYVVTVYVTDAAGANESAKTQLTVAPAPVTTTGGTLLSPVDYALVALAAVAVLAVALYALRGSRRNPPPPPPPEAELVEPSG